MDWNYEVIVGTLKLGGNVPIAVLDMTHPCDVIRTNPPDVVQTLQARMGTGGNNVPLVLMENNDDL